MVRYCVELRVHEPPDDGAVITKRTDSLTLVEMSVFDAKSIVRRIMHFANFKWCFYISRIKRNDQQSSIGAHKHDTSFNVYHNYS